MSILILPNELLVTIAMQVGIEGALTLKQTSRRLFQILQPAAWKNYNLLTNDIIVYQATVETVLHTFDQVQFIDWNGPAVQLNTFMENDELGGVKLRIEHGKIKTEFYSLRENLSCYLDDITNRMSTGEIPPSLGSSYSPIGGIRREHSCDECEVYNSQKVLKSDSVMVPTAIEHTFAVGRNYLFVKVENTSGKYYDKMPSVFSRVLAINNTKLTDRQYTLYAKHVLH